jgi:hypothetical protein
MSSSIIFTSADYNHVVTRVNNRLRALSTSTSVIKDQVGPTPAVIRSAIECTDAETANLIKSKMYALYKSCANLGQDAQHTRHRLILAHITQDVLHRMNRQFVTDGLTADWFESTAKYNLTEDEIHAMLTE